MGYVFFWSFLFFFFQAEDGIRDRSPSRGLGDVYKRQDKSSVGSNDIIYQTVSYIAAHYTEELTLSKMAHDLGISQSSLSRVFSGTFHTNFNRYLNEARLDYACSLLLHSDHTILDICIRAGFDSQRTFNRVFQERYHMSPREYRKQPH